MGALFDRMLVVPMTASCDNQMPTSLINFNPRPGAGERSGSATTLEKASMSDQAAGGRALFGQIGAASLSDENLLLSGMACSP